jgi:hypothetical protein
VHEWDLIKRFPLVLIWALWPCDGELEREMCFGRGARQVWRENRPDSGKCAPDRGRAKLVWGPEPDSEKGAPYGGPCMHIDSVLEELEPLDRFGG